MNRSVRLSERARAEGRVHEMSWLDKAAYLYKYLVRPETSAPESVRAHFEEQRKLFSRLVPPPGPALCRLGFVGDLMWIRRNWENFLHPSTREALRGLDGIVGNLETVVSPNIPVNEFWPDLFLFNSDTRLVTSFTEKDQSLFAALSFANNHTLDHGDDGARDTLAFLRSLRIPHSGIGEAGDKKWAEFSRAGIRFGFYAATFGLNDQSLLQRSNLKLNLIPGLAPDIPGIEPDFTEAREVLSQMEKAKVHVKILSLHWGHEFEHYPTERLLKAARELVSAGADVIVGSHPHLPQPPEILLVNNYAPSIQTTARISSPGPDRKALVFYSLGNFVSAMFTAGCRLSTLWPVGFYRHGQAVDWQLLPAQFFFNRNHRGGRELVPLDQMALSTPESAQISRILNNLRID